MLLSGGLDSATNLYLAKKLRFKCFCLTFDYGQRHKRELASARKIARRAGCPIKILKIHLPWKGSSLLDKALSIPSRLTSAVPSTYVPARNIIFLSFALSYAEAIKAEAIFIGVHAEDYSGYPDCRPEFYRAFNRAAERGIKAGKKIKILTLLIHKNKAQIIRLAAKLGVPLALTSSCYAGGNSPCGECDSCRYRAKGFKEAGIKDPICP